ncbi:hypothetical protein ACQP2E_26570 [Actinoplanes sp. CA-015351]|uniref:hypothetical protein n=1 Tax=Actinoplanes sp. CA-015351 TaxID=3239897 RepID=UPI003D97A299
MPKKSTIVAAGLGLMFGSMLVGGPALASLSPDEPDPENYCDRGLVTCVDEAGPIADWDTCFRYGNDGVNDKIWGRLYWTCVARPTAETTDASNAKHMWLMAKRGVLGSSGGNQLPNNSKKQNNPPMTGSGGNQPFPGSGGGSTGQWVKNGVDLVCGVFNCR